MSPMPNAAMPGGAPMPPPGPEPPAGVPGMSNPGMPGGLSPEQAQIVQIALGDPAILGAIATAVTGGGIGEGAGPALASGMSPQAPIAAPQASPAPSDPRLFG